MSDVIETTGNGDPCLYCTEPLDDGRGVRYATRVLTLEGERWVHSECGLRMVVGGIGHHLDHERWCNREGDPDGGRTSRESALMVWALYRYEETTEQ